MAMKDRGGRKARPQLQLMSSRLSVSFPSTSEIHADEISPDFGFILLHRPSDCRTRIQMMLQEDPAATPSGRRSTVTRKRSRLQPNINRQGKINTPNLNGGRMCKRKRPSPGR